MSGLWAGLWSNEGDAALLDVVLMAALAGGGLDPATEDRLGRVIQDAPELAELDWDLVLERAELLGQEAPLFTETRRALPQRLIGPAARRRALGLALQVLGDSPGEERQAVVAAMAQTLGVPEQELEVLGRGEGRGGLLRAHLNDPRNNQRATLFTALEGAEDDEQRALVLYKIDGIRRLLWRLGGRATPLNFAERLRFEDRVFRVDVTLEHAMRRRLVRLLAPGEALHAEERPLLRQLAERLPDGASLLVAHFGPLAPADRSFLMGFDPQRLETIRL